LHKQIIGELEKKSKGRQKDHRRVPVVLSAEYKRFKSKGGWKKSRVNRVPCYAEEKVSKEGEQKKKVKGKGGWAFQAKIDLTVKSHWGVRGCGEEGKGG